MSQLDGRPLPTGWVCRQSKSRSRCYFFNTATGESSWKHPLDIEKSSEKISLKRNVQEDGPVSSGKKTKPSKKHKSDQAVSPSRSDTSKGSKRSSGHSNKNINRSKSPLKSRMGFDSNGYEHLCVNSKVGRINAWVNSVDNSYAPSEQGTCISVRSPESPEDSFDQSYHRDDVVIQTKSPSNKASFNQSTNLNTATPVSTASSKFKHRREHSRSNQEGSRKGISLDVPKQDSNCSNSQGYTPFSPISPQPAFIGQNSVRMDINQPLPAWSVNAFCAAQSSAAAQETNLVFSHGCENKPLNTERDQTTPVDDKDMAMDIDNYEELEDQIKVELQEIRSDFVPDPSKVSKEPAESSSVTYTDTLYVVLDTNVLLSHLKLISELRDFPIEGVVRPVLVVPWIVVQELDSLKSDAWKIRKGKLVTSSDKNGECGVGALARSAVRFLHLCFENDHPRVRGQTACEANEVLSSGSIENPSNDDRILQCCLLFQRKAKDGHAVLFSNDQNLCSKALINGVKAFTHKGLIKGLKELFPSNAVVLKKDHFKDYYNELRVQENLAEKRAKADDIACELQCVLREGLAVVVETEMRAAYDDLWDKVVYIKPPWTLIDLLQLLDKHWIAVFGLVLERKSKRHVDELRTHFRADKGSPGCLANTAVIIEQAHALFEAIAARSSYNGAATKCLTAIIVLQRKCKEYQNDGCQQSSGTQRSVAMGPPPQIPALGGPDTKNSSRSSSTGTEAENFSERLEDSSELSSLHEISTANIESPHALVLSTFETIWNAVTQFSAQIFNGVGFPSPVPVVFLENLPKPTKSEAIHFLTRLCTCLACVVNAIQGVLHEPAVGEAGNPQSFEILLRAITQFFEQILCMNTGVTVSDLCRFARDPDTRMGLIQGCSQLDRALATLQQCSTWVVSSEQ